MTMTTCHDGTTYQVSGAASQAANLLSSGTYLDTSGHTCTVYPNFGDPYAAPWPPEHYHLPWYPVTTPLLVGVRSTPERASAEKPHETVARALKEIAQATRALKESAEAMGVPVDAAALDEALMAKLRAALT